MGDVGRDPRVVAAERVLHAALYECTVESKASREKGDIAGAYAATRCWYRLVKLREDLPKVIGETP